MTADQKFTLLIAGLGLIFSVLTALLGLIWRSGRTSGQVTTQLQNLVEDVGKIATSIDEHISWHWGESLQLLLCVRPVLSGEPGI